MHHTVGRIFGAWDIDYKICKRCGAINWYENEVCHACGNESFRETRWKDVKWLEEEIEKGNLCEECELTV